MSHSRNTWSSQGLTIAGSGLEYQCISKDIVGARQDMPSVWVLPRRENVML